MQSATFIETDGLHKMRVLTAQALCEQAEARRKAGRPDKAGLLFHLADAISRRLPIKARVFHKVHKDLRTVAKSLERQQAIPPGTPIEALILSLANCGTGRHPQATDANPSGKSTEPEDLLKLLCYFGWQEAEKTLFADVLQRSEDIVFEFE